MTCNWSTAQAWCHNARWVISITLPQYPRWATYTNCASLFWHDFECASHCSIQSTHKTNKHALADLGVCRCGRNMTVPAQTQTSNWHQVKHNSNNLKARYLVNCTVCEAVTECRSDFIYDVMTDWACVNRVTVRVTVTNSAMWVNRMLWTPPRTCKNQRNGNQQLKQLKFYILHYWF